MEGQFCINWPSLVEEAKQRRKAQKLTQVRLAELAGVSTPTVSRFESGDTDIRVPSVLGILTVLGMTDQRVLIFPEPEEREDFSRMAVIFTGRDGDKKIMCAISREALDDHFDADGQDLVKVFRANRECIEHLARRKYLAGQWEKDGSILVKSADM